MLDAAAADRTFADIEWGSCILVRSLGTEDSVVTSVVPDGFHHMGISGNVFSSVQSKATGPGDTNLEGVLFENNPVVDSKSDL